ncbi:ATP-dependent nuclease [Thalassospira australica]|uniref:ATP-dependent nuclease n=1 Tax=Thalassospira australica TaxID=1528106 RepID=UPI00384D0EA7
MQLKRIRISNFRSIQETEIELGETTVLIGPNNSGKTAILEALRIALTRRWGQRGTGFTEYDMHLSQERTDPKVGPPLTIEVELEEKEPEDWPDDLQNELEDIIQFDPMSGKSSIFLRVTCAWDELEDSYVPRWEFLNVQKAPLTGRGARSLNFQDFFQYLPVFYLGALRDANDEFSAKSQFWGKLLRTINIPEELEQEAKTIFDELNTRILNSDPKLQDLTNSLSSISAVSSTDTPGQANLRILPLNTWDILSKAEVIYQSEEIKPWLPLERHGQGIQSLSVLFLFKSFVEILLHELYKPDSTAVLALEEPETHLHPQAARALWRHTNELDGQKIITTHSPYFLQHVPFRDIRVVRNGENGSKVLSLPRQFKVEVPYVAGFAQPIQASNGLLEYDQTFGALISKGEISQNLYRDLLRACTAPEHKAYHEPLRRLYETSKTFISDAELEQLETFARRIRGEIFFARRWLLVEGQSDYNLVHGTAKGLGYDLDEHGVAVIDFKNCGNPSIFAVLARALEYPWLIVVDGDPAGLGYIEEIKQRGFSGDEVDRRSFHLPDGYLEQQLIADGLQDELKDILISLGIENANTLDDEALLSQLKKEKNNYTQILAKRCVSSPELAERMPGPMRTAIRSLRGLE